MAKAYVDTFSSAGNLDGATSSDGLFAWSTTFFGSTGTKSGGDLTLTSSDYITSAECDTDKLYVEADMVSQSGGGGWWIALQKDSTYSGNGLLLNMTSVAMTIYRINSGAYNVEASQSFTQTAGTYRAEYDRATGVFSGLLDNVQIVTATTTAEPTGSGYRKAMLGFDGGTNVVISEFRYGDIVTSGIGAASHYYRQA